MSTAPVALAPAAVGRPGHGRPRYLLPPTATAACQDLLTRHPIYAGIGTVPTILQLATASA